MAILRFEDFNEKLYHLILPPTDRFISIFYFETTHKFLPCLYVKSDGMLIIEFLAWFCALCAPAQVKVCQYWVVT